VLEAGDNVLKMVRLYDEDGGVTVGTPISDYNDVVKVEVITSGRTNQLAESCGALELYGYDISYQESMQMGDVSLATTSAEDAFLYDFNLFLCGLDDNGTWKTFDASLRSSYLSGDYDATNVELVTNLGTPINFVSPTLYSPGYGYIEAKKEYIGAIHTDPDPTNSASDTEWNYPVYAVTIKVTDANYHNTENTGELLECEFGFSYVPYYQGCGDATPCDPLIADCGNEETLSPYFLSYDGNENIIFTDSWYSFLGSSPNTYKEVPCSICFNLKDNYRDHQKKLVTYNPYYDGGKYVVGATATVFADTVVATDITSAGADDFPLTDDWAIGKRGRFMPEYNFSYFRLSPFSNTLSAADEINNTGNPYNRGFFNNDFRYFHWDFPFRDNYPSNKYYPRTYRQFSESADVADAKTITYESMMAFANHQDSCQWIPNVWVQKYSPDGYPMVSKDIYGRRNVVQYYDDRFFNQKIKLYASNAESEDHVYYESFEDYAAGTSGMNSSEAHTGEQSRIIEPGSSFAISSVEMYAGDSTSFMRLWTNADDIDDLKCDITYSLVASPSTVETETDLSLKKIVRTGEWTLVEIETDRTKTGYIATGLSIKNTSLTESISIDDIRVQPEFAATQAFVYNDRGQITAVLNNDNMAVYYLYDGKGAMVRNQIETSAGIKTVKEQFANSYKINRENQEAPASIIPNSGFPDSFDGLNNLKDGQRLQNLPKDVTPEGTGVQTDFNIFEFNFKEGKSKMEILNMEQEKLEKYFKVQKKDSVNTGSKQEQKNEKK
jgi:hypothetical protein